MKRLVLLLIMAWGPASYTPFVHAATGHPRLPTISQLLRFRPGHTASAGQLVPEATSHEAARSGVISSAPQLRLAPNYLGIGAGWTMTADQTMSPDDADRQTIQGSILHPTIRYSDLGAAGLYYEESVSPVANSTSSYWLTYLASYYTSEDNATAAFNDALSGWQTLSPQPCPVPSGMPSPHQCESVTFTPQNPPFVDRAGNVYRMKFRVLQISNALFEYGYLLEQSLFNLNQATGDSNLDVQTNGIAMLFSASTPPTVLATATPTVSATVTPTSTPTPTTQPTETPVSFELLARWEKPSNKPNPSKKLSKARKGTKIDVVAFVTVDSAPASEPVAVILAVTRGGKTVLDKSGTFQLDSSDPTRVYPSVYHWTLPKKAGTYKLTTSVAMGDKSARSFASLKVT